MKFDKFLVHQFSSNRTFVNHVTQQDEAFNPVGSGESSDESEMESISPVTMVYQSVPECTRVDQSAPEITKVTRVY